MSLLGFGTFSGCLFYFQDKIKKKYPELTPISGGLASTCALTISYPTDLLRRRLQLQSFDKSVPIYHNKSDMLKKIYKSEGIHGFYRGLLPNYCKSLFNGAYTFMHYKIHSLTENQNDPYNLIHEPPSQNYILVLFYKYSSVYNYPKLLLLLIIQKILTNDVYVY